MSEKPVRKKIGNGAFLNYIKEEKFHSNRITVCLVTPLKKETATVNALIPFMLRKGCKSCPDFTLLNRKLAEMYGAILDADVSKFSGSQIVEITLQFADSRYAIAGENMVEMAAELLSDLVFEPNLDEKELFPEKDFELERECLIDTINSELNDKRVYAIRKTAGLVFEGEPFGIKRYGYIDDAEKLTPEELVLAWKKLVKTSQVEIMFTGNDSPKEAERIFSERIGKTEREPVKAEKAPVIPYTDYREAEETMDIVQGKLVMAYRMGAPETEKEKNAARVFSALYGATPFSKLFMNVREKMSLCYYVSSHFERTSGVMLVDSGIEQENRKKAQTEIERQLELVKRGDFTDDELAETKLIIKDSLGTIGDTLGAMEGWYLTGILDGTVLTPEEDCENISAVTMDDVVSAAQKAKLAALFFLKGREDEK